LKQSKAKDTDVLIESIGRKVLYCKNDNLVVTEEDAIILPHEETGRDALCCPQCTGRLKLRSEDRINWENVVQYDPVDKMPMKLIRPSVDAPRDSVTRWFTSPWGRVKAHISVHSYFAPFVELNGVPCPAIKRLIDEEFNIDAINKSCDELGPYQTGVEGWRLSAFLLVLQETVYRLHLDPNAVPELDVDLVAA
jgi:uncharacterized protein YbaR (Trm112 family)